MFSGELIYANDYSISIELTSMHNNESWVLTNIYGPCTTEGKRNFIDWFKQIQVNEDFDSMVWEILIF